MARYRVGVGDRVRRLHNGEVIGTVIEVDGAGNGFTVMLDNPTGKQIDRSRGRCHYDGLSEGRLELAMSALRSRQVAGADDRPTGLVVRRDAKTGRTSVGAADLVASTHKAMTEDMAFDLGIDDLLDDAFGDLIETVGAELAAKKAAAERAQRLECLD